MVPLFEGAHRAVRSGATETEVCNLTRHKSNVVGRYIREAQALQADTIYLYGHDIEAEMWPYDPTMNEDFSTHGRLKDGMVLETRKEKRRRRAQAIAEAAADDELEAGETNEGETEEGFEGEANEDDEGFDVEANESEDDEDFNDEDLRGDDAEESR